MERNPHRIIFCGAQNWPLASTLEIFEKARGTMPTLELYVCRTTGHALPPDDNPQIVWAFKKMAEDIDRRMKLPGVTEFPEDALVKELQQAAIWCYPTHLPEAEILVARLAQLHGAIPVFSPVGMLATQVFAGIQIYGIAALDRLVVSRFAYEIVKLAASEELQEAIRVPMMEHAAQTEWAIPPAKLQEIIRGATKIQGWMTEGELVWLAEAAARAESVVEIGCWKGRSTYALASACNGRVYAVDHWQGGKDEPEHIRKEAAETDLFAQFRTNLNGVAKQLITVRCDSVNAASHIKEDVDIVFIDGGHGEDDVRADIRAWLPHAKKCIAGHDYDWPSVKAAVDAELGEVERGAGSLWFKRLDRATLADAAD